MYYPYFRGKQYDLFALTALLENDLLSPAIQPIIEPVKNSNALKKFIHLSQEKSRPFYLIQNPQAGDFLTAEGMKQLHALEMTKALIVEQPLETLTESPELFIVTNSAPALESDWQNNQTKVLVPEEFRLLEKIKGQRILSQDVFTRLPRSSFYQECQDELFSTAHLTYQKRNFVGFSDFSIDSRIYYEHSYPSKILSLHLVYFDSDTLRIHHFLSSEEAPTQKEKFFEMMDEITTWLERLCGNQVTLGLQLLLDAAAIDKFPGMGVMRKAAVMHHIELMARYLNKAF
ncbi:sce7725 family protein [uncultured Enterococcus sp.]|uniref:sce7725 family protein n=1 Tax=uncultured Enterococcus sp. TaxID=167972 RepID=UPI002AA62B6F|nr:sce7725 family protein [uncultured Enterococcus sp.]